MPDSQHAARISFYGIPHLLMAAAVGLGLLDFWTNVLMGPGFDTAILRSLFEFVSGGR